MSSTHEPIYVSFDVEATSPDIQKAQITALGAVHCDLPTSTYYEEINAYHPLPPPSFVEACNVFMPMLSWWKEDKHGPLLEGAKAEASSPFIDGTTSHTEALLSLLTTHGQPSIEAAPRFLAWLRSHPRYVEDKQIILVAGPSFYDMPILSGFLEPARYSDEWREFVSHLCFNCVDLKTLLSVYLNRPFTGCRTSMLPEHLKAVYNNTGAHNALEDAKAQARLFNFITT